MRRVIGLPILYIQKITKERNEMENNDVTWLDALKCFIIETLKNAGIVLALVLVACLMLALPVATLMTALHARWGWTIACLIGDFIEIGAIMTIKQI